MAYPGRGSILQQGKVSMGYHIMLCNGQLFVAAYGDGSMYDPSEWVAMNTTTSTSALRELVSAAVWTAS